jgi:predicted RNase H-like nuclease
VTRVLGVDAAAREWLAILLVDGRFAGADLQPSITALLRRFPDVEVVGVDIPIGLPVGRTRPADEEAKRFVGIERAASVFPTFPREVLATEPYKAALEKARELLGSGVSTQGYALRKRIFEVEAIPKVSPRVVEVHPEVSFRAMRWTPLGFSKHTWNGIAERRALLAS